METSVVKEFLLFDFQDWLIYGKRILDLCKLMVIPALIFSILIDKFRASPAPLLILRNAFIASFIILATPTYYKDVTGITNA